MKLKKEDENDIDLITGGSGIVRKAKTIKKGKWKGHRAILYYNAANNSNNDSIVVVHYDREYGVGRHNYSSDFSLRSKNARVDAEEYYAGLQDL